eukprot:5178621-Lingulodinium_polyedra.AAC.1
MAARRVPSCARCSPDAAVQKGWGRASTCVRCPGPQAGSAHATCTCPRRAPRFPTESCASTCDICRGSSISPSRRGIQACVCAAW